MAFSYSALDVVMPFLKEQTPHSSDFPDIYKLVLWPQMITLLGSVHCTVEEGGHKRLLCLLACPLEPIIAFSHSAPTGLHFGPKNDYIPGSLFKEARYEIVFCVLY